MQKSMSSNYSSDRFEAAGDDKPAAGVSDAQTYKLKLSIDLKSVKNFKVAANMVSQFSVNLGESVYHQFKSAQATSVPQNQPAETALHDTFAAYDFLANKGQLGAILGRNSISVALSQANSGTEIGQATIPLKMLEQGE